MSPNVSKALKNGRMMSCMRKDDAAELLRIDSRTLSRYETTNPKDSVKQEDPSLIASAIRLYDDSLIGLVYLTEHPVFMEMRDRIMNRAAAPFGCACPNCQSAALGGYAT